MTNHRFCTAGLFVSRNLSTVLGLPCVRIYKADEIYDGESIESEVFRNKLARIIHHQVMWTEKDPKNAYVFIGDHEGSAHLISSISRAIIKYY